MAVKNAEKRRKEAAETAEVKGIPPRRQKRPRKRPRKPRGAGDASICWPVTA